MLKLEMSLRSCQPNSRKLPARLRRKEVPVAGAYVSSRRHARASPQHHLAAHELAVVFAQRPSQRLKPRITQISARSPLPAIAKKLRWSLLSDTILSSDRLQPAALQQISGNRHCSRSRLP